VNELNDINCHIAALERELAEAKEREEEGDAVCKKLSDLLARVAIALKGEPPDMTLWSFHDLPELVATLAIENAILKEQKGDTNADV
jgi:hypothetical protein